MPTPERSLQALVTSHKSPGPRQLEVLRNHVANRGEPRRQRSVAAEMDREGFADLSNLRRSGSLCTLTFHCTESSTGSLLSFLFPARRSPPHPRENSEDNHLQAEPNPTYPNSETHRAPGMATRPFLISDWPRGKASSQGTDGIPGLSWWPHGCSKSLASCTSRKLHAARHLSAAAEGLHIAILPQQAGIQLSEGSSPAGCVRLGRSDFLVLTPVESAPCSLPVGFPDFWKMAIAYS